MTAAMVEREPITVVVSQKGWIRALKGTVTDFSTVQFKGDDKLALAFPTETTAKIVVLASNGKVFTLEGSKLPGGRGFGDPIALHADIEGAEVVTVLTPDTGAKYLIARRFRSGLHRAWRGTHRQHQEGQADPQSR